MSSTEELTDVSIDEGLFFFLQEAYQHDEDEEETLEPEATSGAARVPLWRRRMEASERRRRAMESAVANYNQRQSST